MNATFDAAAGVVVAVVVTAVVLGRWRPRPARVTSCRTRPDRPRSSPSTKRRTGWIAGWRGALLVVMTGLLLGPLAAVAAIVVAMLWPRWQAVRADSRARRRAEAAYPDFVDLLVLGITSGCTPRQALDALVDLAPTPARAGIAAVVGRSANGERFAAAVGALQRDPPHGFGSVAQPLADALALADRYGTPLPPILDRLADEARAQRRRNAEIAARRLPIQLAFPLVGCTLPSFVLLTVVPLMAGTFSSLHGITP